MFKITLEDIMCDHPIRVKETVSTANVAHLLLRYRINGILVSHKDNNDKLVGLLTTTDLLSIIDKALTSKTKKLDALKNFSDIPVGKVARKKLVTLQKNTSIVKAIAIMHRKKIHTLPVYDGNKLVGVVGRHDLLNAAFNY